MASLCSERNVFGEEWKKHLSLSTNIPIKKKSAPLLKLADAQSNLILRKIVCVLRKIMKHCCWKKLSFNIYKLQVHDMLLGA